MNVERSPLQIGTAPGTSATLFGELPPMPPALGSFVRSVLGTRGVERLDTGDWKGQCVSLVARYIQQTKLGPEERKSTRQFGDGRRTALMTAAQFPQAFERFVSPLSTGSLPALGAVVSFEGSGPTARFGHTAIVVAAHQDGNLRSVRLLESDYDDAGANSVVRISDWLCIDGPCVHGRVAGWCNPR